MRPWLRHATNVSNRIEQCLSHASYHVTARPVRISLSDSKSYKNGQSAKARIVQKSASAHIPQRTNNVEKRRQWLGQSELKGSDIKKKVQSVLKSIKPSHARLRDGNLTDPDYLSELDPDGQHWAGYEEMINSILDGSNGSRDLASWESQRKSSLLNDLTAESEQESWRGGLKRRLKFAFIDYVLNADGNLFEDATSAGNLDLRYPTEWYPGARFLQRNIHLHVGPTNSGKTYTALKRLEESQNGFYAGPLRLLAHEVYSRFNQRGINCELITGDDVRLSEQKVSMYSSTVEMVDTSRLVDVGVIDEIQMIASEDRGWAWTRCLLGCKASELHLCGEARVVPLIRELVASMGDTLYVHQYERLNPLKVLSRSLKGSLKKLRKGDCVVSFSVMNIHALRKQIELDTGKRCAVVYGSLPPETRAQQAALFNDPDNDYDFLVASDAIGMGLNLSIKRIIFETTMRFNGTFRERLTIPNIKQIAGRAGRYRTANDQKDSRRSDTQSEPSSNVGLVTCLDEADLPYIQKALSTEAPPIKAAGLLPPGEAYEELARLLPRSVPFEYIMDQVNKIVSLNPRFRLCDMKDQLGIARILDQVPQLQMRDRLIFCAAPANLRGRSSSSHEEIVVALARAVASREAVNVADVAEIPLETLDEPMSPHREYLEGLETLHKALILFLWLSYRFPTIFADRSMAVRAKELTEEKINTTLTSFSANPKLRKRLLQIQKSSAVLREQIGMAGITEGMEMTMNPDASVEEVEQQARSEETPADGETEAGQDDYDILHALDELEQGGKPRSNLDSNENQHRSAVQSSKSTNHLAIPRL